MSLNIAALSSAASQFRDVIQMLHPMKCRPLHDTRLLLDRMVCELRGCITAERLKPCPNAYLLSEWEQHLVELSADREALCGSRLDEHHGIAVKYEAEMRLRSAPLMRLTW